MIEEDRRELERLNPNVNIELFSELFKVDLISIGKKINVKSLLIAGDKDQIAPVGSVQKLASQISNSEFVIMKNCGHIVVKEKPVETASIILKWLNS